MGFKDIPVLEWSPKQSYSEAESVPADLLTTQNIEVINKYIYLSRFVLEAKKTNGENYPPATLHQLLCGIMRHMKEVNPELPNFLSKADKRFKVLHNTMDVHFHNLYMHKELGG